jgi:hypothetical protein
MDGRLRRVLLLVLALVAGAALAAFQVLPLAEYIAHSDMLFLRRFARSPIPPLRPWLAAAFVAEAAWRSWRCTASRRRARRGCRRSCCSPPSAAAPSWACRPA